MARKGVGRRGQFTFNLQTFLRSLSRYFLLKRTLLGTLEWSSCSRVCDDRYRDAIVSRLRSGKKKERGERTEGKSRRRTEPEKETSAEYVRTYFAKFRDGFSAANTRCSCSPSMSRGCTGRRISSERREIGTGTRLFRSRRFPITSIKVRSAYLPRSSLEPSIAASRTHRDIHYQIFEFKMGNVHIILSASRPTCRFHNMCAVRNRLRARARARRIDTSVVVILSSPRTFRRVCAGLSLVSRHVDVAPIDAARYISRWMRNTIYKLAYGNGEIKSRSGFRILISRAFRSRSAFYYFHREFSCQHCDIHMFRFAWSPQRQR